MVLPQHPAPTKPVLSHFSLEGQTALVTGGCRGIGLEAARGLAEAGAKVAITYSTTSAEEAAARVFERQHRAGGDGRAALIFTSSVSGILVNVPQRQAAYNASKAAVTHLAKSLAVEWADFARVNCISPGFIATDST